MLRGMLLLAGFLLSASDVPPDANHRAAEVRRLVLKLDSSELAERQSAEAGLLKLGPQVLELLPQETEAGKAEMAQRIGRIRQKLQRARASLGVQFSQVTLQGTMSLGSVLASFQEQTGNSISTARLDNAAQTLKRSLDVDYRQTPFWPALDRFFAQTGLDVYPYGERGMLELVAPSTRRAPGNGYVSYAGPFRFQVVSLMAQRELRAPEARSLKVELEVAWEPRLSPIHLKQRLGEVQATDDRGTRLAAGTPDASLEATVPRGPIASRLVLPLALPPREARTIAQLRGTLSALVPGQVEPFRFADLGRARKTSKRVAGASVTLEEASTIGKSLEVRLLVHFDQPGDALASHRTWIFNNPVYLQARDRKTVAPESLTPTRQTADEVGIALTFSIDRAADEYTLVYQTPTMIHIVPLEYQFRDIPLP